MVSQINLDNIELNVRKRSTIKFIIFIVITLGYYIYFWLWKLVNDINKLDFPQEKRLNFWKFAVPLIILDIIDTVDMVLTWDSDVIFTSWDKLSMKLAGLIYLIITIVLVKKLEEYALKKYGVKIKHRGIWMFFFSLTYTNFAINNFAERVKKTIEKQK